MTTPHRTRLARRATIRSESKVGASCGVLQRLLATMLAFATPPPLAFAVAPRTPLEALAAVPLPAASGNAPIKGAVVSALGPVAGATVVAVRTDGRHLITRLPDTCPGPRMPAVELRCAASKRVLAEAARRRLGAAPVASRATAGADGTFTLSGLAPGHYAVYAFGSELVGLVTNVQAGDAPVEIEVTTGIMLVGSIAREVGPTAGTTVTAFHEDAPILVNTVSQPDGRFRIGPLPEGTWFVVAEQDGALPDAASESEHWAPISGVDLSLNAPRRIVGTVRDGGKPAANVRVQLPYVDEDEPIAVAVTDDRGRFVFENLEPAEYAVTAVAGPRSAHGTAAVGKERSATVDLALGTASFVRGRVVGLDGASISGATVRAEDGSRGAGAPIPAVRTDKNGSFRLGPLRPGTYEVEVEAPGRRPESTTVAVKAGLDAKVRVAIAPEVMVSGRITAGGKPVGGASIKRDDTDDSDDPYGVTLAETKADGTFELYVTSPGTIPLRVEHPDHLTWHGSVTAPSPPLEVKLQPGLTISGTVVDETGRGVRARIRLFDPKGSQWPPFRLVETDVRGRFTIRGLPAAPVRIAAVVRAREWDDLGRVGHYLARSASTVIDLRHNIPPESKLEVGTSSAIAGRFAHCAGGHDANVTLTALPFDWDRDHDDEDPDRCLFERDGAHGGGYLGPDCRFEFRGLPPGRYAIDLSVSDSSGERGTRREVTLDSGKVVDLGEIQPVDRRRRRP